MPIEGFNSERCATRNRIAARRDGIDAVPLHFLRDAPEGPAAGAVKTRGYLPTTPAGILARINAMLPDGAPPLAEGDVYWHFAEAANSNFIGDRYCFLDKSTLANIAADAESGVSFMNSHRTGGLSAPAEMPFGRTFAGQYQEWTEDRGGPEKIIHRRALIGFYMLRGVQPNGEQGPTTDALHAMIGGGTVADVSVGLHDGDKVCDVCGQELYAYDTESGSYLCPHAPGTTRRMTPEQKAAQKARGVPDGAASYSLVDARCHEVSAVFDGAVPGAGFRKTLALARAAGLTPDETQEARHAFASLLTPGDKDLFKKPLFAGDTNGGDLMNDELDERAETILTRALKKMGFGPAAPATDPAPAPAATITSAQKVLLDACFASGVDSPDRLADLQARAAAGDEYAALVKEEAKKEAVRLFGPAKGAARAAEIDGLSLAAAQARRDEWREISDADYRTSEGRGATRQTVPTALPNHAQSAEGVGGGREQLTAEARKIVARTRGKSRAQRA
ncbi:MAG: hypothetical protein JO250_09165 [Armatimonadetes bacterium]|nr:hypothetical protein [Armatimonadota bacterium]